jgi:hypothetical protein
MQKCRPGLFVPGGIFWDSFRIAPPSQGERYGNKRGQRKVLTRRGGWQSKAKIKVDARRFSKIFRKIFAQWHAACSATHSGGNGLQSLSRSCTERSSGPAGGRPCGFF